MTIFFKKLLEFSVSESSERHNITFVQRWPICYRLSKSVFNSQTKCPAKRKLCMKMCRKGHKTQKKCVKIGKIRLDKVIFTVLRSKTITLRKVLKNLRRCATVCLPLLESLICYWPNRRHQEKHGQTTLVCNSITLIMFLFSSMSHFQAPWQPESMEQWMFM